MKYINLNILATAQPTPRQKTFAGGAQNLGPALEATLVNSYVRSPRPSAPKPGYNFPALWARKTTHAPRRHADGSLDGATGATPKHSSLPKDVQASATLIDSAHVRKATKPVSREKEVELTTAVYAHYEEIYGIIKARAASSTKDSDSGTSHVNYEDAFLYIDHRRRRTQQHIKLREDYERAIIHIMSTLGELTEEQRDTLLTGSAARDEMVRRNVRLVYKSLASYQGHPDHEDFIQEGIFGLMTALERFDPSRGVKFSTFARYWIRACVQRYLKEMGHNIKMPMHIHEKIRVLKRETSRLRSLLGREPSTAEIADWMETTETVVCEWLQDSELGVRVSLDRPGSEESDTSLYNTCSDPDAPGGEDALNDLLHLQRARHIEKAMSILSPRDRKIVREFYQFEDGDPMTLGDLGKKYGLTKERIRQILLKARKRLRPHLARVYDEGVLV